MLPSAVPLKFASYRGALFGIKKFLCLDVAYTGRSTLHGNLELPARKGWVYEGIVIGSHQPPTLWMLSTLTVFVTAFVFLFDWAYYSTFCGGCQGVCEKFCKQSVFFQLRFGFRILQIWVYRRVSLPSPAGKGDREAVDEESICRSAYRVYNQLSYSFPGI